MNIALFFTRGISLALWHRNGLLEREAALYAALRGFGVTTSFITYGGPEDMHFAQHLPGIRICCNRFGLPRALYAAVLPLLHMRALMQCAAVKSNQMDGAEIAMRAAACWNKPLIARCGYLWSDFIARRHGPGSPAAARALRSELRVCAAATRIVVTTPAMRNALNDAMPGAGDKTVIIPNYILTDMFFPRPAEKTVDCLFIGRLTEQKNVAALLEAISGTAVSLHIIGDGPLRRPLQERFGTLKGRITWSDPMPHRMLPDAIARARIFVLPSLYEGHPKVLLEAMACGAAVLGTDVQGIGEIIRHGVNGLLCEPVACSLRSAILTLLQHDALRGSLGEQARADVEQRFSLETVAGQELELYRLLQQPFPGTRR
jgi:glycosyltransferase involved in cell wall biosynthesis